MLEEVMEVECEYWQQKMHFLEEELAETRNKLYETVAETRCYAGLQISEMEQKVYVKSQKAEEMRSASHLQASEILAEEKYKV